MIGINVIMKAQAEEALRTVLECLPDNLACRLLDDEFILNEECIELAPVISLRKLKQLASTDNGYFISGRIFLYPNHEEMTDIVDFEDFYTSKCQAVLLIVDAVYLEMYCKDEKVLASCVRRLKQIPAVQTIEQLGSPQRKRFEIW